MASLPSFFFLSRSTSFSFFILFLFFPMHARKSNARSFRVITNAASLKEFLDCKVKEIELRKDSFEQEANAIGRQHSMPSGRIPDRFDPIFGSKAVKEKDEDPRWKSGVTPTFKSILRSAYDSSGHKINHDKHPGFFYSDYSQPRTRPPSHN